jgi:anaerobic magnesium-protoporphyrin IX monomethyl ester cyclase
MKIKKVMLIVPPDTRPLDMLIDKVRVGLVAPLGLAYIAAVLEQNGYEVKILDCVAEGQLEGLKYYRDTGAEEMRYGLLDSEIELRLMDFKPDLVGVSCMFSNKAFDAHNVCRIVKQWNKDCITVMGGSHPTALVDETLGDKNVNGVIKGEGEQALLKIIQSLNGEEDFVCEFGKMEHVNLDSLPLPARHLLPMDIYLSGQSAHSGLKNTPMANISSSRGCPGRCSFCAIRTTFGDAYRERSPENVLAEIDHLVKTYKIKELHFEDDNLTANKKRAMAIFQGIIDRKYNLSINSPSGLAIFAMDEELLDKMKEAGYYSVSFAIESGVPWVLKKLMHKHVDLNKAKRLVKYARSIGLKVKAFFILGMPGETKETMLQTVEYAGELGADWSLFFPATTLPGTELDMICRKNNWLIDPNQDTRYYFFKPNIRTPEFDPEFVLKLKDEANQLWNFDFNINIAEGKYERAREDFAEVVKLYPNLEYAKEALRRAESKCRK